MPALIKAGRYELRGELGRGAMGVVYRGYDPTIGREVAVKTLRLTEAGTGMSRKELVGRFQIEARAAGLLSHPNIVTVYDAGEEDGVFFITMELVEGRSLEALLDGHQLFPLARVMRLMEQACAAIDFAHQHNVVHRDIKPANLMLTADDTLKITDFGTAKIMQFGTAQTQHVMGTPSYMSPEQVKGKPVDGRSDIFSLGVILYELMTGEKPFPGQNITTVIYKIINEDPIAPRALDSAIHEGLSAVISRALAKDPAARFQTCHELLEAMKNYRTAAESAGGPRKAPHGSASSPATESRTGSASRIPDTQADDGVDEPKPTPAWELALIEERQRVANKRRDVVLTLVLLAIIGFTGYHIWPVVRDVWHGFRTPPEMPALLTTPAPATPDGAASAPASAAPEAKSATPAHPASAGAKPAAGATGANRSPAP